MSLRLNPPFRAALADSDRTLAGVWACTGSPLLAEISAGSGMDWLLIDMEHSANTLESVLVQLQVCAGYPIIPVVRVPANDSVILKQVLDLGAQNIIVPMVSSAEQAQQAVSAVHYPPRGVRGVGSALARSARWNRVDGYLNEAAEHITLVVQIETAEGVAAADEIVATPGIDAVFVGPSDLAASMGVIGQQNHPDVLAGVHRVFAAAHSAGVAVGVNAFDPAAADAYIESGADFIAVGADVALLARATEALAARFVSASKPKDRASY